MKAFFRTLFRPQEQVCSGATTYSTEVHDQSCIATIDNFVSLNPLRDSRKDANCTAHRNFLIEIDKLPLSEQLKYVEGTGVPFTSMTYSGNKSFHFVVALADNLRDKVEYAHAARWLHGIVEKADHSTRNPSRFTRVPGSVNNKTGRVQELIKLEQRVSNEEFYKWLNHYPHMQPRRQSRIVKQYLAPGEHGQLSGYTQTFLRYGAIAGYRNNRLYSAACDMALNGYTFEEACDGLCRIMLQHPDITEEECITTITSAFNRYSAS